MFETLAELQLFGVYLPPLFLVCLLGLLCAVVAAQILNRSGLSSIIWHPPLAFFALWMSAKDVEPLFDAGNARAFELSLVINCPSKSHFSQ